MLRGGEQLHRSFPPHEPDSPPGERACIWTDRWREQKNAKKRLGAVLCIRYSSYTDRWIYTDRHLYRFGYL
jgi:hypothetical protein